MKLGLVTYNMAAQWDVATIIKNCRETGFEGVEFRTTHKHGVEDTLTATQRAEVKKQFADSGVVPYCVGTACEYHAPDAAVLRQQIEASKRAIQLAADIGMEGVKVRPNNLPDGVPEEQTLEQIGRAFREVAAAGSDAGVAVWMEVHGRQTCRVDRMRRIVDVADHPNARLTWNCNGGETDASGSIGASFALLQHKIGCVHIHELWPASVYPYAELFRLLRGIGFTGWTSYEGSGSSDPLTVMRCYRRIWELLQA